LASFASCINSWCRHHCSFLALHLLTFSQAVTYHFEAFAVLSLASFASCINSWRCHHRSFLALHLLTLSQAVTYHFEAFAILSWLHLLLISTVGVVDIIVPFLYE